MKTIRILRHFLRLIRWQNLIIVIATMFLMRYAVISPLLGINNLQLQLSLFHFMLLVFSTTMITAAGYIINDYFDRKTDLINKPYRVIVGRFIKRRAAMLWHTIFNIVGVFTGVYVSFKIGFTSLGIIFILTSGLLWFYSTNYKRQVFIGNLVVAVLTAMVPLLVLIYEFPLVNIKYHELLVENNASLAYIKHWVYAFAYFAFLTTLIREIVKDTEDLEGDNAFGRSSIPLVLGIKWTKIILFALLMLLVVSIIIIMTRFLFDIYSVLYLLIIVIIPTACIIFKIYKANDKKDYSKTSILLKLIMAGGVLYSLFIKLIISTQLG